MSWACCRGVVACLRLGWGGETDMASSAVVPQSASAGGVVGVAGSSDGESRSGGAVSGTGADVAGDRGAVGAAAERGGGAGGDVVPREETVIELALFELSELETDEWKPIYSAEIPEKFWTIGKNGFREFIPEFDWKRWRNEHPERCRDCGAKSTFNQGGAGKDGHFMVCDKCAAVDRCRVANHQFVAERRSTGWSIGDVIERCTACTYEIHEKEWDGNDFVLLTADEIEAKRARHRGPRHHSKWGEGHEIHDCEGLKAKREQRRAKYRREMERLERAAA